MSNKSEPAVVLTSYSVRKQDSIETYFHEWKSIHQSQAETNGSGNETDEELQEKDDQGIYTNPEAIWLEKLGFGSYVSQLETGESHEGAEDSLLTNAGLSKHHAHAIRRRMNTLRSTVKSRRKKESMGEIKERPKEIKERPSDNLFQSPTSPTHLGSKVLGLFRTTPNSSPQSSPVASRRNPNSYRVNTPDRHPRRDRNGEIDSGVYSANSSRDGTPVRGHHAAGEGAAPFSGLGAEENPRIRTRSKVVTGHSSKHRSTGSISGLEDNGLHGFSNGGEGMNKRRSGIDPASLNLVSKAIEHSPEAIRRGGSPRSGSPRRGGIGTHNTVNEWSSRRPVIKRSSSEQRPLSPNPEIQVDREGGGESKSLPRGRNKIRSASPSRGTDSPLGSPQDIKLHFGSPAHNGNSSELLDELPNFMISHDALGITRIQDLSHQDMEKVRSVALLELTVTFDDHDIPLRSRRPAKAKSYPENALCGVPLSVLLQSDQKREPTTSIPLVFDDMMTHLETCAIENEGLLRIPGSAARVNSLLQRMEETYHLGQFSFDDVNINDTCSLLKQFIRELPIPLLTREYLPAFASVPEISGLKEQVRTLNLLVLLLPDVHQKVLKRLLEFCEKIIHHSATNKMDLTNIAMVIAPNLFTKLPSRHNMDPVAMATKTSHIVRLLIKYHNLLWTIPGEMLRQIRYLYENEVRRLNPRSVQRAIKQMHLELMDQQPNKGIITPKVSHHIIRVKAPLFTRVCMAVDICVGVTAGDIITKLQKKSRLNQDVIRKRFSSSNLLSSSVLESPIDDSEHQLRLPEDMGPNAGQQFLYEVGGNIGERCLPNETDMYSLYSINPQAQWVIKPRNCPDLK